MRVFGRRFAAEVGFIVVVAIACAVANLRWPAIVSLVGAAWVLTAFVEFVAWRRGHRETPIAAPVAGPPPAEAAEPVHVRVLAAGPEPVVAIAGLAGLGAATLLALGWTHTRGDVISAIRAQTQAAAAN